VAAEHDAVNERRALAWFAVGAVVAMAWLAAPFATGLLVGALMAFTVQPVYEALARRTGRPVLAALTTVLASAVIIVGAVAGFVRLFVTRAIALAHTVSEELRPGGAITAWVDAVTRWLDRFGVTSESLTEHLRAAAGELGSRSAGVAGAFASSSFIVVLGLFFALLTMYLVLRHWPRMVTTVAGVSPLLPEYTRALLGEFQRVGRMTLSGAVLTGLAQGALAAIGFWITGVPDAVFFGVATALASLVPAVGTLLVWIPLGLYLFAMGYPGRAIVELAWGALIVVGFCDYVIRPRLVGDEGMPVLLTFLALFGGLEVLGLSGLIVGPVVMALAVAVLRLYAREENARRSAKA
jgi:predicted PurR-regulated permease PerM